MHDALAAQGSDVPIFPADHPHAALVCPSFDSLRRRLRDLCISAIWVDADLDPDRAGFRPSYDGLHGPGASTLMPFIAAWMSTGRAVRPDANLCLFLDTVDRTLVSYATEIGILGPHAFVRSLDELKRAVRDSGRRLYSIDDVGTDFDDHVMVTAEVSEWLNSKHDLASISAYAPVEIVKDMYAVGRDDYHAVHQPGGRVFLKTCNTESAGLGVEICATEEDFEAKLATIRDRQAQHGLSRTLVVQAELIGRNRSFQVFLDPRTPDEIPVVALTDQLVEADGKTYKGSVNYPVNADTIGPVAPVILDMVERIRARYADAFGFLMVDFFEAPDGRITVYDPGIRPSGNTATALVGHFARKLTGRDRLVCNAFVETGEPCSFATLRQRLAPLFEPGHLAETGTGVFPWGWNALQGSGILIVVAGDQMSWDATAERVAELARG